MINRKWFKKLMLRTPALLCAAALALPLFGASASASSFKEQNIAANQAVPIESNKIPNWPTGPVVSAESAILMELETGVILYEKNIHEHQYPASTTKILTTLIASEESSLDETVVFSHAAVFGIPVGSNHIAMDEGDTLSMDQCLQAILIRSANEVSYAVAEHIGGTWEGFAEMMNARARELGCVDSNFVNPNGLPDENHYTSAYDLAMIGRAFFSNEMLCQITLMPMLYIPKEDGDLHDANQMDLLPGRKYAYKYLVGCKTGYTDAARSCLVSCAEKDGLKLICVVLNDESPLHYEDTVSLFDYGFNNFEKVNVSQTETKYNIDSAGFYSDNDIFGNSKPILSLNQNDCIILPKTVNFDDTVSKISYSSKNENQVAVIDYTYQGVHIGSASVDLAADQEEAYSFDPVVEEEPEPESKLPSVIFINILKILLWGIGLFGAAALIFLLIRFFRSYEVKHPNNRRNWKRSRKRRRRTYQSRGSLQLSRHQDAIRQAKRRQKKSRRGNRPSFRNKDFDL